MDFLLTRAFLAWCLVKARTGKVVLVLCALLVVLPSMMLRLKVTETFAEQFRQEAKLSRRFLVIDKLSPRPADLDRAEIVAITPQDTEENGAHSAIQNHTGDYDGQRKSGVDLESLPNIDEALIFESAVSKRHGKNIHRNFDSEDLRERDENLDTENGQHFSADHRGLSKNGSSEMRMGASTESKEHGRNNHKTTDSVTNGSFDIRVADKAFVRKKDLNAVNKVWDKRSTARAENKSDENSTDDTEYVKNSLHGSYLSSMSQAQQVNRTEATREIIEENRFQGRKDEDEQTMPRLGCRGVLKKAIVGTWVPRPYSEYELEQVQTFINNTRDSMGFPPSLQRHDRKCGNISFGEYKLGDKITYKWFRALCNPFGNTPCCEESKCVSRSVERCDCEGCLDMRQQIHAELSTWVPKDPSCKLIRYKAGKETCTAMEGFTVHFLGDSLLRQIFVALLHLLQVPDPERQAKEEVYQCKGYYTYLPFCARFLPFTSKPCGHKNVVLRRSFLKRSFDTPQIVKQMSRYVGKRNSLVVLGLGMHDHLNTNLILETVVEPIVSAAAMFNSSWPRIIWVSPHAPGLLKSPWLPAQLAPGILHFNGLVNPVFTNAGIPVLDTFGLTKDGVMTYDGLHYGEGVNILKAHILLNYIQEIRKVKTNSKTLFH